MTCAPGAPRADSSASRTGTPACLCTASAPGAGHGGLQRLGHLEGMHEGIATPFMPPDLDPRAMVEAAPECILVTTPDLDRPGPTIVYVNPAFERMTGWSFAEVAGRTPRLLQGPLTDQSVFANMRAILAEGGSWEGQAVNYRKDGSTFVMEWSITPLRDGAGTVRHFLAVQRNVTRRVEAERRAAEGTAAAHHAEWERANLARYFSPRVVELLASREVSLEPLRRPRVAILFADIEGFTALAEVQPPEAVMGLLREFHRRMEPLVFAHEGSLEKYIGDALLAAFGVPDAGPGDAVQALACARAMLLEVADWNAARAAAGEPPLRVGFGLHYGPVVIGDVGSARSIAFAVIGDTVNTASRLQGLTRIIDTDLVVSGPLVAAARAEGAPPALLNGLVPAGRRRLRGRRATVEAWILKAMPRERNVRRRHRPLSA